MTTRRTTKQLDDAAANTTAQSTAAAIDPRERAWTTIDSPIGTLTVTRRGNAVTGIFMDGHSPAPDPALFGSRSDDGFAPLTTQLAEYFAGERAEFDLELDPDGTPFQQQVWAALREIPFGETRTYGWLAERIGKPTAFRAVGLANGRNPISIVVPCHRVVGSSGALTGYGGGVERKAALLAHETGLGIDATLDLDVNARTKPLASAVPAGS